MPTQEEFDRFFLMMLSKYVAYNVETFSLNILCIFDGNNKWMIYYDHRRHTLEIAPMIKENFCSYFPYPWDINVQNMLKHTMINFFGLPSITYFH